MRILILALLLIAFLEINAQGRKVIVNESWTAEGSLMEEETDFFSNGKIRSIKTFQIDSVVANPDQYNMEQLSRHQEDLKKEKIQKDKKYSKLEKVYTFHSEKIFFYDNHFDFKHIQHKNKDKVSYLFGSVEEQFVGSEEFEFEYDLLNGDSLITTLSGKSIAEQPIIINFEKSNDLFQYNPNYLRVDPGEAFQVELIHPIQKGQQLHPVPFDIQVEAATYNGNWNLYVNGYDLQTDDFCKDINTLNAPFRLSEKDLHYLRTGSETLILAYHKKKGKKQKKEQAIKKFTIANKLTRLDFNDFETGQYLLEVKDYSNNENAFFWIEIKK